MPALEHVANEAALLVARVAVAASTTAAAAAESSQAQKDGGKDNHKDNSNSPLLFFVALGFGVVFTNLWCVSTASPDWLKHDCVPCRRISQEYCLTLTLGSLSA